MQFGTNTGNMGSIILSGGSVYINVELINSIQTNYTSGLFVDDTWNNLGNLVLDNNTEADANSAGQIDIGEKSWILETTGFGFAIPVGNLCTWLCSR